MTHPPSSPPPPPPPPPPGGPTGPGRNYNAAWRFPLVLLLAVLVMAFVGEVLEPWLY